jgi:hypothetical protein
MEMFCLKNMIMIITTIRKDFRNIHDLYNISTKTNQIVKKKIDKMRSKVDRIKN